MAPDIWKVVNGDETTNLVLPRKKYIDQVHTYTSEPYLATIPTIHVDFHFEFNPGMVGKGDLVSAAWRRHVTQMVYLTTEFFVFQQSFLLNTTFRPRNSGLLRVYVQVRRPEFPGRNVVFNKNDCWKTKNSVVECKASENFCENGLFVLSNVCTELIRQQF